MRHIESDIQIACVKWFRLMFPSVVIFSSLNGAMLSGTPLQRKIKWKRLVDEGALVGVADLFIMCPNSQYHGLFVEMKTEQNNSKQSDAQRVFEGNCNRFGYKYAICRNSL